MQLPDADLELHKNILTDFPVLLISYLMSLLIIPFKLKTCLTFSKMSDLLCSEFKATGKKVKLWIRRSGLKIRKINEDKDFVRHI